MSGQGFVHFRMLINEERLFRRCPLIGSRGYFLWRHMYMACRDSGIPARFGHGDYFVDGEKK